MSDDVVEELASMDKLAHDVSNLHLLTILFVMDGAFIELEVFDDMLVVERLDWLNLVSKQLECPLIEFWVVETENFDGVLLAIGASAQLDLCAEAGAEGSSESVLSNSGCHTFFYLLFVGSFVRFCPSLILV